MARKKNLISFEWTDESLVTAVGLVPFETEHAVSEVVRKTTNRAFKIVKNRTPVDRGRARRGWKKETRGTEGRFFNDVAYINVLEFGPYPVTATKRTSRSGVIRRGKGSLGGAVPPSVRGTAKTQRTPGGRPTMRSNVSKQAPQGMVRITLQEIEPRFVVDLVDAINSLPSWGRG